MLDLDIGMNEWLTEPFKWDDSRKLDRGKVMTYGDLETGKEFGRYLDVDGDGIPYRTYPGTHPTKGGYFTRGTSRNPYARYSEEGSVYVDNVQRLLRKFETAKSLVPAPVARMAKKKTRDGRDLLRLHHARPCTRRWRCWRPGARRIDVDLLRVRAFPFADEVMDFIADHDRVFLVEQNRDGQLRTLVINEGGIDPAKLIPVLHYDGTPITARFIVGEIGRLIGRPGLRRQPRHRGRRMTYLAKPRLHHPQLAENSAGLHPPRL